MVLADRKMKYRPKYVTTRSRFQMMIRPWYATLDGERYEGNWMWADERRGALGTISRLIEAVYWDDPETGERCGDVPLTVVFGKVEIEGIAIREVLRRLWNHLRRRVGNRVWFWWRRGRWVTWRWWGRTRRRIDATLVPKARRRG